MKISGEIKSNQQVLLDDYHFEISQLIKRKSEIGNKNVGKRVLRVYMGCVLCYQDKPVLFS